VGSVEARFTIIWIALRRPKGLFPKNPKQKHQKIKGRVPLLLEQEAKFKCRKYFLLLPLLELNSTGTEISGISIGLDLPVKVNSKRFIFFNTDI
jgi:hypothetical protein